MIFWENNCRSDPFSTTSIVAIFLLDVFGPNDSIMYRIRIWSWEFLNVKKFAGARVDIEIRSERTTRFPSAIEPRFGSISVLKNGLNLGVVTP